MPTLRISELATAAGVPTSTLRYYERIGLVRPRARSESGYRLYDDDSVDRLAFIGRAKRLGMSLDDVATLIEAWFSGECEPLRDQLRAFVSGRIGELRRQIADESAFERQLQRILSRLDAAGDAAGAVRARLRLRRRPGRRVRGGRARRPPARSANTTSAAASPTGNEYWRWPCARSEWVSSCGSSSRRTPR